MPNEIKISDKNKEKVNQTKFKNIKLYDYQIKTIEKLLEHEKGQMLLTKNDFKLHILYEELKYRQNNFLKKKQINNKFKKIFETKSFNFGYNIGVLSNKVGSGKTFIVLGMIMSRNINSFKILKKYYIDDIYNNTNFDLDTCSIISEYLVEENDVLLNISKKELDNPMNLYKTQKNNQDLVNLKICKDNISNLIIVPHNLYQQWKDEIENKTSLDVYYIKTKRDFVDIENKIKNKDLVLCNVNKLKDFLEIIKDKFEIDRLFIDEADTINLSNFPEINSKFIWLITTTYERILKPKNQGFITDLFKPIIYKRTKKYYKNILDKITYTFNSEYIDLKVDLKNPKKKYLIVNNNFINKLFYRLKMDNYYKFINSYDYPSLYEYILKSGGYYNIRTFFYKLNYIIRVFFDIGIDSNIDTNLELSYTDESSILYTFIINIIFKLYSRDINDLNYQSDRYLMNIENIRLHKYNSMCCSTTNLFNQYHNLNNDELLEICKNNNCCTMKMLVKEVYDCFFHIKKRKNSILKKKHILEYIKEQLFTNGYCMKCFHLHNYNEDCIETNYKIIFDRYNLNLLDYDRKIDIILNRYKNIYPNIFNDVFSDREIIEPVTHASLKNINLKIKHMINKLKQDIKNKKRCLIFSDNYNFFKFIEKELKANNIKARVLKGNSNTINSIIKRYKNYEIDVLLMNMKYSGSGLNLQMSDNIYIMNMIDKNTEKQVIGRVNRISKKDNFEINYFFNDDEYELYNQDKEVYEMLEDNEEIIIEEI